jgi:NAD(P) transhydrogenase
VGSFQHSIGKLIARSRLPESNLTIRRREIPNRRIDGPMRYDIAVIGNDEAAFEMLTLAAASNKKTIAILPDSRHSAWFVGQALRRLVSSLLVDHSEQRRRMFRKAATPKLLHTIIARAVVREVFEYTQMLETLSVHVMLGEAGFIDQKNVLVARGTAGTVANVEAENFVIGTGVRKTAMHRPFGQVPFRQAESLFAGTILPDSVHIIGGGSFGAGLASLVSLFGVKTQLITRADNSSVMLELATAAGVNIGNHPADVGLEDLSAQVSKQHTSVVDCRRAVGFTEHLCLDAINVEADEHGKLWCANNFETWCSGIFGIGEVVGFSPGTALHPSLQAQRVMAGESRRTIARAARNCA